MKSSKRLQYLLISFVLYFADLGCFAQKILNLPEGRNCSNSREKSSDYMCRKINECMSALQDLKKNIRPTVCSVNAAEPNNPIVCCRLVKTFSAAEKCLEYSDLIYVKNKQPALSPGNDPMIKVKDCYSPRQFPEIAGGKKAEPKEFPHMALIGYHETKDSISKLWLCGGSLISLRWVLSAAHCDQSPSELIARFVRLGQLNTEEPEDGNQQDFEIKKRVVHPFYRRTKRHYDIALFRLDRDIIPTSFVRPLCLHTEKSIPSATVVATGWGRKAPGEPQSPDLLKVTLDVMSVTQCSSTYKKATNLPMGVLDESMLCAGVNGGGKDTCGGDSGGPIQIPHPNKNYTCLFAQVGITSFGKAFCGIESTESVYTRVSAYLPWIEYIVWPKI